MKLNTARIERAQALMQEQGLLALMIMNHDDYQYFFGESRTQPRAILPAIGQPIIISFAVEEAELRDSLGEEGAVMIFSHVGEQISNVRKTFRKLLEGPLCELMGTEGKPKIGMQMWFDTPAFLVEMFRRVNPQVELVASDPVMDALRMVKDPEEQGLMRAAQAVAAQGMDRARELLAPGVSEHEVATEVLYTMMKAGASGTSTPIHVNSGPHSCWVHGRASERRMVAGDLVVINLTPRVQGYCGNLARSFVLGEPVDWQKELHDAYLELHEATRQALVPGTPIHQLDKLGRKICDKHGLGEHHIKGISHGIGLRFEE
ncbi:MAG: aminopeptidase P family protein, partial [Deltaproteobacteria bacterium]|nr:aminopeptidase P family protein [Deltaproteobacteria bacterium]